MAAARTSAARPRLRPRPVGEAERRLELLEALLQAAHPEECARRALGWLQRRAGVRRGVCLATHIGEGEARLIPLASVGVPPARLRGFGVDLEARDHPLTQAIFSRRSTVLPSNGHAPSTPLGAAPVQAIPLRALEPGAPPAGLLLLTPLSPAGAADAQWLSRVLGPRLFALAATTHLHETGEQLRHEHTLLYSIINTVTDPILLTDADGRIMIANARAEALLATGEDQSEGRRRAVALNNMLFSAVLSRHALEGAAAPRREVPLADPVDGSDLLFEVLSTVTSDAREGTGVVSVLRNVTDLQRATVEIEENYRRLRQTESEARAEKDRLELVIDSVADPIIVTDPGGNIVMMNAPAERLFTVPDADGEEAQRIVQANDAHFSSFVSNVFFEADARRRSGSISLVDPRTGIALPMEAISGKIVSEHAEVTAVVTILHDRTEELERARLYEELKKASAELERKVREATSELVHQNELLRRCCAVISPDTPLSSMLV